jgi:hypothetical protein
MKQSLKILTAVVLIIVIACGTSYLTDTSTYTNWKITHPATSISWAKFEWANDNLGGKHFEKTAMLIPCTIEGVKNPVTFQFDLGAGLTGLYENAFVSFYTQSPQLQHKIKRFKSSLQFWNKNKCIENLEIHFGDYTAVNATGFIYKGYGEQKKLHNTSDTVHLGSAGTDLFKDKILIIDYPNKQFAICETIPPGYQQNLVDIEISNQNKIILPMTLRGKNYRIMFDNGSSIFPLITAAKNISNFSGAADSDTIEISSWGKTHMVTGKLLKDTFELAGKKFSNIKVYANHSGPGIDDKTDGMTGNALFWNNTIIIDFKNRKFGIK